MTLNLPSNASDGHESEKGWVITAERLLALASRYDGIAETVFGTERASLARETAAALRAHEEAMRECERRTAKYDKFGDDHYRGGFDACDAILSILTGSTR